MLCYFVKQEENESIKLWAFILNNFVNYQFRRLRSKVVTKLFKNGYDYGVSIVDKIYKQKFQFQSANKIRNLYYIQTIAAFKKLSKIFIQKSYPNIQLP